MRLRRLSLLTVAFTVACAAPIARAATDVMADVETLPEDAYTQAQKCIHKGRIYETDIFSRDKIVFRMNDKQRYLVQLPTPCPGLKRHAKVMYVSDDLRLCSKDYLRPVYEIGLNEWAPGARCHMGMFEPITEEQYEALEADYRPADAPSIFDLIFGRQK